MSDKQPPSFGTRFQKGRSGNPNGRPRKTFEAEPSAFEIILGREIPVTIGGETSTLSPEEALQQKLFDDAMKGNIIAQRKILAMIIEREKAKPRPVKQPQYGIKMIEAAPQNANEAARLLGIAVRAPEDPHRPTGHFGLQITFWAAQTALRRRNLTPLSPENKNSIKRVVERSSELVWPRGEHDR